MMGTLNDKESDKPKTCAGRMSYSNKFLFARERRPSGGDQSGFLSPDRVREVSAALSTAGAAGRPAGAASTRPRGTPSSVPAPPAPQAVPSVGTDVLKINLRQLDAAAARFLDQSKRAEADAAVTALWATQLRRLCGPVQPPAAVAGTGTQKS